MTQPLMHVKIIWVQLLSNLKKNASLLINWINNHFMKANPDKFYVVLSEKDEICQWMLRIMRYIIGGGGGGGIVR